MLLVKKYCGNNKNGFIVGYKAHTEDSQTPSGRSLFDLDKMIHDF
jgi:hypothetical protein